MTSRRAFLAGSGAAVAAAVCPALPSVPALGEPIATVPITMAPPPRAWIVGIEDHPHDIYWADTKAQAVAQHLDSIGLDRCDEGRHLGASCEDDDCEECMEFDSVEAARAPKADRIPPERRNKLTNADLYRAGFSPRCDHCQDAGAYRSWDDSADHVYIVDEVTVCGDCLHHQPLDIIRRADPDIYAEALDELLSAEYGEALA